MNSNTWLEKEIREMVQVVSECRDHQEVESLFELILTPREINDIARRLKVLRMIANGHSYLEIRQSLSVSSALISRLSYHVGFGFRRTNSKTTRQTDSRLPRVVINYLMAPKIKYKGAPGIIPK